MEPLQKKILGWTVIALSVVGVLFLGVLTSRTLNTATTTNTVSFSGTGTVNAAPDVAVVSLSIVTEAANSESAQNENSRRSEAVVKFLRDRGIEERDIKTSGYNIYPQYTYPRGGQPVITGYQVNQSIEVKIRNLEETDVILDGVVGAGANQVNNLQLTIDDPDKLREEARALAIADAKDKAKALERQLGIRLGRIINFGEDTGGYPVMFRALESDAMDIGGGTAPLPEIPVGENEISVNVTLTWQIK
ncbi:MAG TPA: SIMPL domain-containing protein [Candidatus Paceibacterota bacterium]|nr:SIMPL domain-containing protein [Candidatus Paceibacterota bacterium]